MFDLINKQVISVGNGLNSEQGQKNEEIYEDFGNAINVHKKKIIFPG